MAFKSWALGVLSYYHSLINFMFTRLYPKLKLETVDLTGQTAVVTGANGGVGFELAVALAASGARVILACRSEKKGLAAKQDIKRRSGNDDVHLVLLDVASMSCVKTFVDQWENRFGGHIDILINNAGMSTGKKTTTSEGLELTYQVNLLSNFALILLLLKKHIFSPNARIVNTSSQFMFESPRLKPEDANCEKLLKNVKEGDSLSTFTTVEVYARAKAGVVLFTRELQNRLSQSEDWKGVTVQCYHPGIVLSEFWTAKDGISHNNRGFFGGLTRLVGIPPKDAAVTPYFLATSPQSIGNGGHYWQRCKIRHPPGWMDNAALRGELWRKWEADSEVSDVL